MPENNARSMRTEAPAASGPSVRFDEGFHNSQVDPALSDYYKSSRQTR